MSICEEGNLAPAGTGNEGEESNIVPQNTVGQNVAQYRLRSDLPDNQVMNALRQYQRWVAWAYEIKNGRQTKIPKDPATGRNASVADPATWSGYEEARECQMRSGFAGVGFVLIEGDDLCGGDLDHCLDWWGDLPRETYAEYSPSGEGIRLLFRGNAQTLKCDAAGVEIYRSGRFLTITGNHVPGSPLAINEAPATLVALSARVDAYRSAEKPAQPLSVQAAPIQSRSQEGPPRAFWRAVNDAALANLDLWVPILLPMAKRQATGAWRVASRDLGRNFEEDLSIHPDGIQDFGPERSATAIDLVQQHRGVDAKAAALWLCDMLKKSPALLGWAEKGAQTASGTIIPKPKRSSRFFPASSWGDAEPSPREWVVEGLVPRGTVTSLYGDGGTGKSLLALQLAVDVAIGGSWVGKTTTAGRSLFISAEDDQDELHRRVRDVASSAFLDMSDLADLHLRSLAGEDALLATLSQGGGITPSDLFDEIERYAEETAPDLIVLDTLADLFPGNENDRGQARQFIGLLRGLAIRHRAAVLLLAHPSLSGMSSGTGTGGNTAWNNSVRSRLYMQRVLMSDGGAQFEPDPDVRTLDSKKANYGRVGESIQLRWVNGVFQPEIQTRGTAANVDRNKVADDTFLRLLAEFKADGRSVKAAPAAGYAPKVFADSGRALGLTKGELKAAMERLFARKVLVEAKDGIGPASKQKTVLMLRADMPKSDLEEGFSDEQP